MRIQAVEAVIAAAKGAGAESLEAALDWAATIAADETDDWSMRLSAGSELLDFPRDRHRLLLTELADQQKGVDRRFFREDVDDAYEFMNESPQWEGREDPWEFYHPEKIMTRQERWARAEERLSEDEEDVFEELREPYVRSTP